MKKILCLLGFYLFPLLFSVKGSKKKVASITLEYSKKNPFVLQLLVDESLLSGKNAIDDIKKISIQYKNVKIENLNDIAVSYRKGLEKGSSLFYIDNHSNLKEVTLYSEDDLRAAYKKNDSNGHGVPESWRKDRKIHVLDKKSGKTTSVSVDDFFSNSDVPPKSFPPKSNENSFFKNKLFFGIGVALLVAVPLFYFSILMLSKDEKDDENKDKNYLV